jgi:hypothetical protein
MSISPELDKKIEDQMKGVTKFQRPKGGIDLFLEVFPGYVGRAAVDKSALVGAGLDENKFEEYEGLSEKLSREHAVRVNADGSQNQSDVEYNKMFPSAEEDFKILISAARFAVKSTGSPEIKRVYSQIPKGSKDTEILSGTLALVEFCRQHPEIIAMVRPAGRTIDEAFLKMAENNALTLQKLKGAADNTEKQESISVDRQNRLITLCVQAQRQIKLFAEQAFLFNPDHYDKYYAESANGKSIGDEEDDQNNTPVEPPKV